MSDISVDPFAFVITELQRAIAELADRVERLSVHVENLDARLTKAGH